MTIADLAIGLEQSTTVVIDVRAGVDFERGHIPGSWSVDPVGLPGRLRDVDDPLYRRLRHRAPRVVVVAGDEARLRTVTVMLAEVDLVGVGVSGEVAGWSRAGRPLNRGLVG